MAENKEKTREEKMLEALEQVKNELATVKEENAAMKEKLQEAEKKAKEDVYKRQIRTIPNLVYDESRVEDIDTNGEDHIYDECRYVFMSKPIAKPRQIERFLPPEDPLDLYAEERNSDKYEFYRI